MHRREKKFLTYVVIVLVPFLCLFVPATVFSAFKLQVVRTVYPIGNILSVPILEVKKLLYYHRIYNEYMRLRKEVDVLKGRLVGIEEVMRENSRYGKVLDFKRKLVFSSVTANVIGRDPTNWNASVVIDRGSKDGITLGMPVVSSAGVVGRVSEVASSASRVILLTDPQFSVAASVQESRESGLISGTLQGFCRLRYVAAEADVKVGDKVITSKVSTSFPEGLLIGDIIGVRSNPESPTAEYVVRPAVYLSQLEEVLVIRK